jgi:pimeloyl-ACP methyl ester carboxylesterase
MKEWSRTLADGRFLGGAEYGDPQGRPVFLFHGQPGNRLFHPDEELTRQFGVRLIVPDRPGYGLSTYLPERRLLDWPYDTLAIADHLGIEQFEIIAFSGGGPYGLACAAKIPDRLTRVVVAAGAPPMHIPALRRQMQPLARINYFLTRFTGAIFPAIFRIYWRQARKTPAGFIEIMRRQSPLADQKLIENPETYQMLLAVWQENLRVDSRGYVLDARLLMDDWGFQMSDVETPIELVWGAQDLNVPPSVMDYFSAQLPHSTQTLLPEAGHFAILTAWEHFLTTKSQI